MPIPTLTFFLLAQARLDASITRVRFDQRGQDQCGNLRRLLQWQELLSQCFFQCLASGCRPTVQGLTRDLMSTAQFTHHPVGRLGQHLSDYVDTFLNNATTIPIFSLRTVIVLTVSPYLSGILFVNVVRQSRHSSSNSF